MPGTGAGRKINGNGKDIPSKFPPPRTGGALTLSEKQINVLKYLQVTLRDNGINAELPEIVQALVEALTARRELCEGLLAAYLTDKR